MLQLQNQTPFAPMFAVFPDADGIDTLYATVGATFTLAGTHLEIATRQVPVQLEDEYANDPLHSSLLMSTELYLEKPSTDIVMIGEAWAPRGRPVSELDVTCSVGPIRKTVRVFGDRAWTGRLDVRISSAAPFTRMPLVYERAFGGILEMDSHGKPTRIDPRNPVGIGPARATSSGDVILRPLPNLEDPARLIRSPSDEPPPANFAFVAPTWEPRRSYVGTYDEAWRKTRAPYLPNDFDPRFFHVASPDLICKTYLVGGEPVELLNASPCGPLRFRLPVCELELEVRIAGNIERRRLRLETVLLHPGEDRVRLLFRGAIRCDKRALRIQAIRLAVQRLEIGARAA